MAFSGAQGGSSWATVRQMLGGAPGRVLLMLCLMYFITYVDRVNLSTVAPLLKAEFHLSNAALGLVLSGFGYTYALFQVIGGLAGDRYGPRWTLTACGLVWALATVATGFVGGLASLLAVRLLLGLGEGATFPTATRAMSNWVMREGRGFAQGLAHSASRMATTVTPPIVVALVAWVGWRGAFVVLGCVSAVWALCWSLTFRDDPRDHARVTPAEAARLPAYETHRYGSPAIPWGRLVRRMMPTTLVYFCYAWTLWLYLTWLPSFFVGQYHMNIKDSALFSFGVFFAGVVGDTVGGVVTDVIYKRTGDFARARRDTIILSFLGSIACLVPVLFVRDVSVMALCLSGAFFFLELTIGPAWSVPMDIAPRLSGVASGIMNTGSAVAAIVSPLAFGLITDLSGSYTLPFLASILLLLGGTVLTFWMRPDLQVHPDDTARAEGDRMAVERASIASGPNGGEL